MQLDMHIQWETVIGRLLSSTKPIEHDLEGEVKLPAASPVALQQQREPPTAASKIYPLIDFMPAIKNTP